MKILNGRLDMTRRAFAGMVATGAGAAYFSLTCTRNEPKEARLWLVVKVPEWARSPVITVNAFDEWVPERWKAQYDARRCEIEAEMAREVQWGREELKHYFQVALRDLDYAPDGDISTEEKRWSNGCVQLTTRCQIKRASKGPLWKAIRDRIAMKADYVEAPVNPYLT